MPKSPLKITILALLIAMTIPHSALAGSHFIRSYTVLPIYNPSTNSPTMSCERIFAKSSNLPNYVEFEAMDDHTNALSIQPGYREAAYWSLAKIPVSRFFTIKTHAYSGYWHWQPAKFQNLDKPVGQEMGNIASHFLNRWITDFGYNPQKVKEIEQISHNQDPRRLIHVGLKVGDVPWAGVAIFDGSTQLRTFGADGLMHLDTSASRNRADLEVRYPDLMLPERVHEKNGKPVNLFFLGLLTSLPEVTKAVNAIYHRIALTLLFKINHDLLIAKNEPKREHIEKNSFYPRTTYEGVPPAYKSNYIVTIASENIPQALFNARGIRIYATATDKMVEYHKKFGWQVLARDRYQGNIEEGMQIIYFEADEFIGRFLDWDLSGILEKKDPPTASQFGMNSREYQIEANKEQERWNLIMDRIKRTMRATDSFNEPKNPQATEKGENTPEFLNEKEKEEERLKRYTDMYG